MGNTTSISKYHLSEYVKYEPGKTYKKYNSDVFWRGEKVHQANGVFFIDMNTGYGKDEKYIFYNGRKIGKLYKHFVSFSNGYAKDDKNKYFRGELLNEK